MAKRILEQTGLTAVGLGISRGNQEPEIAAVGFRRRNGSVPVTTDDRWHIGSVGKSVTATLIATLFEDDFPSLDCPIAQLVPELEIHESWHDCTLYHLLTSTSGLPANFPLSVLRMQEEDPQKLTELRGMLIAKAMSKPAKTKSGMKFQYSNLGYTVLGYIAEKSAGRSFTNLLTERIIEPMGLKHTGFGAPAGIHEDDEPMGHRVLFGYRLTVNPFKGVADNPAAIAPAGRLHMSLSDLLVYGRSHLAGHNHLNPMLKNESWDLLHRPYLNDYGCGWVAFDKDRGNGEMIWHNGSNTFWYTLLIFVPKKDVVLAFVTNDGAIKLAERAFFKVAKEILHDF